MITTSKLFSSLTIVFLVYSCNSNNGVKKDNELIDDKFYEWKNEALKNKIYVYSCPTSTELESIENTAEYSKIQNARILPKEHSVSYGYFNDDDKIDALYSFSSCTCGDKIELETRSIPGFTFDNDLIMVESSSQGYNVIVDIIKTSKIEDIIKTKLSAIKTSLSINEIYGKHLLKGTCKIWSSENSEGLCCPDKLYLITIDVNDKKIWLHINDYEVLSVDEIHY